MGYYRVVITERGGECASNSWLINAENEDFAQSRAIKAQYGRKAGFMQDSGLHPGYGQICVLSKNTQSSEYHMGALVRIRIEPISEDEFDRA